MCGLAGMAGDFSYQAKDVLKHLLIAASVRGNHSTGVAGINTRSNRFEIAKAVGGPHELFDYKVFDRDINTSSQNILIGHCRHATRGGINRHNAHPFEAGRIIGAHNGTLESVWQFAKDTDVREMGTDSETLFTAMDKHGAVDAIAEAKGAWALTWYDMEEKSLNFLRNDKRPLWFCYTEDMKKMFWASEHVMLYFALERLGVKLWKDENGYRFFQLGENRHMAFKVPENGTDKIEMLFDKEVKGNEKPSYTAPFPQTGSWSRRTPWKADSLDDPIPTLGHPPQKLLTPPPTTPAGSGTTPPSSQKSSTTETSVSGTNGLTPTSLPSRNTLTLVSQNNDGSFEKLNGRGPNGRDLTQSEFSKLTEDGCQWCSQTISEEDDVFWINAGGEHVPLCKECNEPTSEFARMLGGAKN